MTNLMLMTSTNFHEHQIFMQNSNFHEKYKSSWEKQLVTKTYFPLQKNIKFHVCARTQMCIILFRRQMLFVYIYFWILIDFKKYVLQKIYVFMDINIMCMYTHICCMEINSTCIYIYVYTYKNHEFSQAPKLPQPTPKQY